MPSIRFSSPAASTQALRSWCGAPANEGGWTPSILIVEDDAALCTLLEYNLSREGFAVTLTASGAQALDVLEHHTPDLILLDWMVPDISGLEVCRQVRRREDGWRIGVIMISARTGEPDRINGLQMGADDYMAKPFSMAELVARAHAVLRRSGRQWG